MYKLIVIDDEETIRKGLIEFIDWQALKIEVVADFENGLEAIEYIKNSQVDLIFSDIRMPGADGIDVAKYISINAPQIKIILYSGYSDFKYAQSAIRYNVSDFIVKPSSIENITQAIQETILKLESLTQNKLHLQKLESKLKIINLQEHNDLIKNVLMGQINPEESSKKPHLLVFFASNYRIMLFKIQSQHESTYAQSCSFIEQLLDDFSQDFISFDVRLYGALLKKDNVHEIETLQRKCEEIYDFVHKFVGVEISIGISNVHHALIQAPIAFQEAQRCLSYTFYDKSPLVLFSTIEDFKIKPSYVDLNLDNIKCYLSKDKQVQALQSIQTLFQTLKENTEPIDYIRSIAVAIYSICMDTVNKNSLNIDDIFLDTKPYQEIISAHSVDDLSSILCILIEKIIAYLSESNNNYIIIKANKYIDKHYNHPIKLMDIAKHIHVNSSYLSRVYKNKTTKTISQHLREVRIDQAKKLLSETTTKTYTIAEDVGFEDSAYFSFVFKQHTGLSPSQYRNENSGL
ncbi:response regulator [Fusibacter sp. 3D3]|uniref:response regulator n=1 Tax=Fusibacter sp. 3D3 TaxID=1048380 RepID=UPI00085318E7|nr:response regulator [Fusibacter sp. 3D3]GAU75560.1 two-component response regulator yesN [Fusibacter sp. 3D3]